MLILSGVSRTSGVAPDLLEALHARHIASRLVWRELTLPILHHVLLIRVLSLRNWGESKLILHLLHIYLVVKII